MRLLCSLVVVLGLVVVSGCSSPESPGPGTPSSEAGPPAAPVEGYPEIPGPSGEWTNKVGDLERDLQNLEAHGAAAADDFADDLESMAESAEIKPTRSTLDALAQELASVLPKSTQGAKLRPRLAQLLFVATRRANMSEDRFGRLQQEVQTLLTTHGVPADRATVIAGHVNTIARRSRRAA